MANNSFKIKNSLVLTPKDLATLVSPEAGDLACDINDSNKIKRYDANSSSWVEVGSGGGVGGTDIFFVQDFESASLASFTQTGLTLSQTDPLHGKVSALLTHQAGVSPTNDQKFKQVIPVDRKFRGESMTLRLNCKSSASAGNVTIKIYDETNAANIVASEQLQLANDVSGAISQVGFTIPATCASISYTITALPQSGSPVTRIDDVIAELAVTSLLETVVELTGNAQTLTIPLTQSGLVQHADSMIRLDTGNGYGSTLNNKIRRFSNIAQSIGSDILYQDSATLGASFTVQTSGVYQISCNDRFSSAGGFGLSKNASSLTTALSVLSASERLTEGETSASNIQGTVGWQGYLVAGDIIRHHTEGVTPGTTQSLVSFTMTKQGSLKQVSVSPDQKITIPTSELRFEGASSRGSTATAIVKFDTQAKLRGDAFTVESDSVLGTRITMKKAGKLSVSSTISHTSGGGYHSITVNQATLTSLGMGSETKSMTQAYTATAITDVASEFDVNIGDIIRINSSGAVTSSSFNNLNLSFQEQDISVSVTNTLPQFSESDSSVRVDTANGYGSFGTKIRRFSSVRDSIGVDVEYLDSATNGASFTAKSSGVYEISYTENTSGTVAYFAITKNSSSLTTNPDGLTSAERLALGIVSTAGYPVTISTQTYLTAGDIIRPQGSAQAAGTNGFVSFTMSKVGKPNVTGVDVTPFVNVPQNEVETIAINSSANGFGASWTNSPRFSTVSNTNKGIISYTDSSTEGAKFTALKRCTVSLSVSGPYHASSTTVIYLLKGQSGAAVSGTTISLSDNPANNRHNFTASIKLEAGEVLTLYYSSPSTMVRGTEVIGINATAASDSILTAPETFSTDTAALTYANAATYTLSTLANAPVGTYITFTYAANTNTRTQTTLTNRPTQTDADMNANGMLIYTRAFNAPSTAGNPAMFAIQIGKGLKGKSLDLYKSAGRVTSGSLDLAQLSSTIRRGITSRNYNEITGVLILDAGFDIAGGTTDSSFVFDDISAQTSGYLVINASKNPALTGIGLNRVAARAISTSGQSIPNGVVTAVTWNSAKTFDTTGSLNTATGVYTAPETGYYQVNTSILSSSVAWSSGQVFQIIIFKNGSSFSTTVLGIPAGTFSPSTIGNDLLFLAKGDTCSISVFHNRGAATALNNSNPSYFSIAKVSV